MSKFSRIYIIDIKITFSKHQNIENIPIFIKAEKEELLPLNSNKSDIFLKWTVLLNSINTAKRRTLP